MKIIVLLLSGLFVHGRILAWGFYGHMKINELAVYTIPKPLFGFYKANLIYMVRHAADADKRRYIDTSEACRHFLDGDHYEQSLPLDTIPHLYYKAIEQYGKDSVLKHGIVPWQILKVYQQLIEAFKIGDLHRILRLSADLGHYVGDCHVPLHATSNYNGQKTAQKGVHALWESRVTELYFDSYDLLTGLAGYIENPGESVWQAFEGSFSLVDSVLLLERKMSMQFTESGKYTWEPRGTQIVRVYSKAFCEAYHLALNNMVEKRMSMAIRLLGSLIYTAWIQAGQPYLDKMPIDDAEGILPDKGNMIGRDED